MPRLFSAEELVKVRNEIPVVVVIDRLLGIPYKDVEGRFRFLCPVCNEFQTGVNPRTNLSRCFRCERNFNTIDLVQVVRQLSFIESVRLLQQQLGSTGEFFCGRPHAANGNSCSGLR